MSSSSLVAVRRTISTEHISLHQPHSHSASASLSPYTLTAPDCSISLPTSTSSLSSPALRSHCTCKHTSLVTRRSSFHLPSSACVASYWRCVALLLALSLFAFCFLVTIRHFTMDWPHVPYTLRPHTTAPATPAVYASSLPLFTLPEPATLNSSTLTFRNFTVPPLLSNRWPTPLPTRPSVAAADSSLNPFSVHSPGRFSSVRGAVVSLYTPNQHDWLTANFRPNCRNLLAPMADHSDWIIYYTLYPHDGSERLHQLLVEQGSQLIVDQSTTRSIHNSSDLYGRLRALDYPLTLSGVHEYVTADDVHVITVPVVVNLPAYLERDAGRILQSDFNTCWGIKWDIEYSLLSGAVFPQQLFLHPVLDGYDYFIKLDMDIQVVQPLPLPSLFHRMANQSCVMMHTTYRSRGEDCGLNASEAVSSFASKFLQCEAASSGQRWWGGLDYYWGNFMGGWLGWMKSTENAALSAYLYEDGHWSGYFSRRWTDQPVVIHMLGMWYNLTDVEVRGVGLEDGHGPVCDYSALRTHHVKHKYREGQPLPIE